MTKLVSVLFLAAAATAAPALARPISSAVAFERQGVHYVGTVTDRADGSRLIVGHEIESGHAFALTVVKGMVDGVYDHQYVRYAAPRAKAAKPTGTMIASNAGM